MGKLRLRKRLFQQTNRPLQDAKSCWMSFLHPRTSFNRKYTILLNRLTRVSRALLRHNLTKTSE